MGAVPKHLMQHAFTTGEMAPATLARQDISKYASGVQLLENFQVAPQGGIYNDTGTVFVEPTKTASDKGRLIPFVFSNTQSYIVELGNLYARFYTDNGQIQSPPGTPVEIVTPYAAADVQAIQFCQSGDFLYLVHPDYPPGAITRSSNTSWAYQVLPFKDGPYQDENTDPTHTLTASATTGSITLTANFAAFQAGNVGGLVRIEESVTTYYNQWTSGVCYQQNDLVTNAGRVYECASNPAPPQWLVSTIYAGNSVVSNVGNIYIAFSGSTGGSAPVHTSGAVGNWTFVVAINQISEYPLGQWQGGVVYAAGYPVYWNQNVYISGESNSSNGTPPTSTNQAVAVSNSLTGVTWIYLGMKSGQRAPVQVSGTESDGNIDWTYLNSGFGYVQITGYTDAMHVTGTVATNPLPQSSTGGTLRFRLSVWDTYNGFPSVICFYESRLCLASNANFPETIWMSNTDDYYNFAPTDTGTNVLDTNSIDITLASGTINQIVWLLPVTRLLVGTIGSEWQIWSESTASGFSPSNVQAKQMSSKGSIASVPCILVDLSAYYVHRSEKRIYEATYNYLYDLYVSKDLNLLAEHILREGMGIVTMCLQQDPYSVIWILREDGVLIGLTEHEDEQISGWHRHVYQGKVESIACIPNSANNSDQLWMIVNRTINGATARYIEYMQAPFYPATNQDKAAMWYVECGLSETVVSPTSTVSGLGYLQGETVTIIVDGAVQPPQVVPSSGTITLQSPANSLIVVGLPYTSTVTILPLDFEGQKGSIQGQTNSVHRVSTRLLNSVGMTIFSGTGMNPDPTGESIIVQSFRATTNNMNQSPPLFTGDYPIDLSMSIENPQGVFTVQQTQPYPLNILGFMSEAIGNER